MTIRTFTKIFSIITLVTCSYAQYGRGGIPAICELSGTVLDSATQAPIEYASIAVLDNDGNVITGGISDASGSFKIREIKPGHYDVKIEFMGFSPYVIEEIKLSMRGNPKKDLGKIHLKSAPIAIDAVNVIEERPIFEFEADKMIYNSSDDIVAGSGTAEDVLNKVPMVTVDQDGEVSLRGNPNVKILINGRPNRAGGDVDNIPAAIIDRVEVITSPSAKYDPEGMAGIINIVLKKGRFEGLNGSIKLNAKHNSFNSFQDMHGLSLYSNYQADKYNIYSTLSNNNRMRTQTGYRRVYNLEGINKDTVFTDNSYDYDFNSESDIVGESFTVGFDYSLSDQLNLNAEASYKNNYKLKDNIQEYLRKGDSLYNPVKIEGSSEGEDDNNYHSEIFFEIIKSYDNPDQEMSGSIAYDYGIDSEFESFSSDTTDIDEIESSYELDFNYKIPVNEKSMLEFGYDGRFKHSEEDMKFELSAEDGTAWEMHGINDFNYRRDIHGFFAEYQFELNDNFSIKPSFRLEFVDKEINFTKQDYESTGTPESVYAELLEQTPDSLILVEELNYFPDLHFTYNISDKKSIQFGVSKRIERPGGGHHGRGWGQLRPFPRSIYNDSFIMIGNPFLEPEFSTQYEVSYKSPMPMGFFYTNLYFRNVKNSIQWYDYDGIDDGFSGNVVTFRNAEGGTDTGVEFFMMVMGQTLGGGYNINELNDSSNDFQLNGVNERLNMYMRVNLPEEYIKIFGYEFGFYYMKMKVPGGTLFGSKGTLWANTGISKKLFDDRASISFSIDNILDSGGFQLERAQPVGDNISEVTEIAASRGGRTFSLSFKYHFGKMQQEKKRGRGKGFGSNGGGMDMGY